MFWPPSAGDDEEEWDEAGGTSKGWLSPSFSTLRAPIPPGTPNPLQTTMPEAWRSPGKALTGIFRGKTHFNLHFPPPFETLHISFSHFPSRQQGR